MRILSALIATLAALPALAVGTSHWVHTSEADFAKGALHGVVATNLGDVKLSRALKTLMDQDARITAVYALVEAPDGTVYAGTGPGGILLSIRDDKVATIAKIADANIFSLAVDAKGALYIGTGGAAGRILKIDHPEKPDPKPVEAFAEAGVQYIWAMAFTPDGNLYAATGPAGQLFEIKPDNSRSVLFDSDENNLLSMASDGGDLLFVGTDPNGLVYRINRKTHEARVIFDAPEAEIGALAIDKNGNVFAGASEAMDSQQNAAPEAPEQDAAGRPESSVTLPAIPSQPPTQPKPPRNPDPSPNEPRPIPKAHFFLFDDPSAAGAPAAPQLPQPDTRPSKPNLVNSADAGQPRPQGNGVYRIDPAGFVTEVFRQNAIVYRIVEQNGALLVATGSEGVIYRVDPAAEETVALAKVDSRQVVTLLPLHDGRILMGLANSGGLAVMSAGYAAEGEFTSPVLDAAQISRFGKIHLRGALPPKTTLTISTRSGNVQDPSHAGWSKWSAAVPAVQFVQVDAPAARFLQYRLSFATSDTAQTPVVEDVDVAFQAPNQAPQVKAFKIVPKPEEGDKPHPIASQRLRILAWEASDPNDDALEFSLYMRSGHGEWILLKDRLREPMFEWDTHGVADGAYTLKVVASDGRANAPLEEMTASRVSDTVIVDNTPPDIGDVKTVFDGVSAHVHATVVDLVSTVANVEYSIDSNDDWQAVPPVDKIYDSPQEEVEFAVKLSPGPHQLTIRATDDHGNQRFMTASMGHDDKEKAGR